MVRAQCSRCPSRPCSPLFLFGHLNSMGTILVTALHTGLAHFAPSLQWSIWHKPSPGPACIFSVPLDASPSLATLLISCQVGSARERRWQGGCPSPSLPAGPGRGPSRGSGPALTSGPPTPAAGAPSCYHPHPLVFHHPGCSLNAARAFNTFFVPF